MEQIPILIIGNGREGRIVQDIADVHDILVYGYLSTEEEVSDREINDLSILGTVDGEEARQLYEVEHLKLFIAEAGIAQRVDLVDEIGLMSKQEAITLIHRHATWSEYVKFGKGTFVHAGSIINTNAWIGSYNNIYSAVVIGADAAIGDYCNIHSGAIIGEGAKIGDRVSIGHRAVICPNVSIEPDAIISAGAVVMRNVSANQTVFGNPAQVVDI